jgi:hypothetical protein
MEQIIKDMKAIIRHLDKAVELAKKDAYTAEPLLIEQMESLSDIFQEKLEEA